MYLLSFQFIIALIFNALLGALWFIDSYHSDDLGVNIETHHYLVVFVVINLALFAEYRRGGYKSLNYSILLTKGTFVLSKINRLVLLVYPVIKKLIISLLVTFVPLSFIDFQMALLVFVDLDAGHALAPAITMPIWVPLYDLLRRYEKYSAPIYLKGFWSMVICYASTIFLVKVAFRYFEAIEGAGPGLVLILYVFVLPIFYLIFISLYMRCIGRARKSQKIQVN